MRALELLAPAKNLEYGIAAIDHGADAVYIGASRFGARAAVGNSVADIRKLCDYAHPFGVKVYVTVNTIVYDDELEATRQLLAELSEAGADAILIQDMAVLEMMKDLPMAAHASTQTALYAVHGIELVLRKNGCHVSTGSQDEVIHYVEVDHNWNLQIERAELDVIAYFILAAFGSKQGTGLNADEVVETELVACTNLPGEDGIGTCIVVDV